MFVVLVDFEVKREDAEAFRALVLAQARNSLELEEACHVFDVSQPLDQPDRFFLYELYDDEAAFKVHLESAHFLDFNAKVETMTVSKEVRTLELISGDRED